MHLSDQDKSLFIGYRTVKFLFQNYYVAKSQVRDFYVFEIQIIEIMNELSNRSEGKFQIKFCELTGHI